MGVSDEEVDKKVLILTATTRLLQDRGAQALTFENVAKEAGLSRQLVRYYFPEMEGLMVQLCDHLGGTYRDLLIAGVVEVEQIQRLDFFLDFFFGILADRPMPEALEIYDVFFAHAIGSETLRGRLCTHYKTLGDVISHELAITYPELKGPACDELSYLFVSMMHAHWSFSATLGYADQHNHLARRAFDRLITSYRSDPQVVTQLEQPWKQKN